MLQETCSGGGPLLLVPAELAGQWGGFDESDGAPVPNDYERACDAEDMVPTEYGGLGSVEIGEGRALVLDAEMMTAWLPEEYGAVVLRNYQDAGLSEEAARGYLVRAPEDGWKEFPVSLTVRSGRCFLFDSAFPGAEDPEGIEADDGAIVGELRSGTYRVRYVVVDQTVDLIELRLA
jgi:hypothetical protein